MQIPPVATVTPFTPCDHGVRARIAPAGRRAIAGTEAAA
jgi:hypothetical protein